MMIILCMKKSHLGHYQEIFVLRNVTHIITILNVTFKISIGSIYDNGILNFNGNCRSHANENDNGSVREGMCAAFLVWFCFFGIFPLFFLGEVLGRVKTTTLGLCPCPPPQKREKEAMFCCDPHCMSHKPCKLIVIKTAICALFSYNIFKTSTS
jgi:hypothetical protein